MRRNELLTFSNDSGTTVTGGNVISSTPGGTAVSNEFSGYREAGVVTVFAQWKYSSTSGTITTTLQYRLGPECDWVDVKAGSTSLAATENSNNYPFLRVKLTLPASSGLTVDEFRLSE